MSESGQATARPEYVEINGIAYHLCRMWTGELAYQRWSVPVEETPDGPRAAKPNPRKWKPWHAPHKLPPHTVITAEKAMQMQQYGNDVLFSRLKPPANPGRHPDA